MKASIYACSSVNLDYFEFLVRCLERAGFEVRPITLISAESYRRKARRRGPAKLWLRFQMYVLYPMALVRRSWRAPTGSIFLVSSNTFYAPAVVKLLGRRNQRVYGLVYDLFPDALEVAGQLPSAGRRSRLLGAITRANHRICEGTVFLGSYLAKHAASRWGTPQRMTAIDISADADLFTREPLRSGKPVEVHYGGQLGYMHDAASVMEVVHGVTKAADLAERVRFSFYISGAQAGLLAERVGGTANVRILGPVRSEEWRERIRDCQLGLVTLTPGGATVCLPSKTYGMMAGGLAIIAICPRWSDLARLIEENEAGWVVPNSPYEHEDELTGPDYLQRSRERLPEAEVASMFEATLRGILDDPSELERRRMNARCAMRGRFYIDALAREWSLFLGD